jgi:hypothetical protein
MTKRTNPYPLIKVHWRDICHNADWVDKATVKRHKAKTVETLGFLLEVTPSEIKLASDVMLGTTKSEDSSDVKSIPRGCVDEVWVMAATDQRTDLP